MPRVSIGTTNVGLYNPLSVVLGGLGGAYYMSYVRDLTYPTQSSPGQARIGLYAQAAGQYLFQIQVRPNSGAWGNASITYPFSLTSTGTFVGAGRQVYNYVYPYITIQADRIYPRVFQYWQIDGGGVYSYSNPLNIYPTDSVIVNNQNLVAIFA